MTSHQPTGETMSIYDASLRYQSAGVPLIVFAGQSTGTGSSRDWAARARSFSGVARGRLRPDFKRIHRSNLVFMGVLPCEFKEGTSAQSLGLNGTEIFEFHGIEEGIRPRRGHPPHHPADGRVNKVPLTLRIDTPIEVEYYRQGGILPYVLRQLIRNA